MRMQGKLESGQKGELTRLPRNSSSNFGASRFAANNCVKPKREGINSLPI
jgi:hypothetical protein